MYKLVLIELNYLDDYYYLAAKLSLVVSDDTSTDTTTKHKCYFGLPNLKEA